MINSSMTNLYHGSIDEQIGQKKHEQKEKARRSSGDIKKKVAFQNVQLQHQELIDRLEKYILQKSQKTRMKSLDALFTNVSQEGNIEIEESSQTHSPPSPDSKIEDNQPLPKPDKTVIEESNQTHSPPSPDSKINDNQPLSKPDKKLKAHKQTPHMKHKTAKDLDSKPERKLGFQTTIVGKPKKPVVDQPDLSTYIATKLETIKGKTTKHELLTGSHYDGVWNNAAQCMDKYGTYTYPDGSIYCGYFSRGHFHGYGTLHLADPYNFTYKGSFVNGVLNEIEDMWFDDGLHVKATFQNWSADFSAWDYCCSKDRRFTAEHVEGLPPVGPYSVLTANNKSPRELGNNCYDVEEGVYNPSAGLIINRPQPFPSISVPCKDHLQWIVNNCRHSSNIKQEIPGATYHKVIASNLESEVLMGDYLPDCDLNQRLYHKRYFGNLCKEVVKDHLEAKISDASVGYRSPNTSSSTCESFADRSPSLNIQENLETARHYENLKLGCDLEREQTTLIPDAAKLAAKGLSIYSKGPEIDH